MVSRTRTAIFWTILICVTAALVAGVTVLIVRTVDQVLVRANGDPRERLGQNRFRYLRFYPYTGNHMTANYRHVGPMPWENQDFYKDFDVSSGDHGFFVDFDLDNPPPKAADEFRIILTGGSGAQGWGGRTNDEMFYRYLETRLNRLVSPKTGLRYRVINLAMGGAITMQNYIALNIWGHKLAPDAVISWSGGNDLFVPMMTGGDGYLNYYGVASAVNPLPPEEDPWINRWLDANLPGIAAYTSIKRLLGLSGLAAPIPTVRRQYLNREGYLAARDFAGKNTMFDVALPTYVHALRSIKRDFQGIPMMVMFQAIDWRQAFPFVDQEYDDWTGRTEAQLKGHVNNDWIFYNLHQEWKKRDLFKKAVLYYGLHLPSGMQEIVADMVIEWTPPAFWQRRPAPGGE
jgi:hypothetical protein